MTGRLEEGRAIGMGMETGFLTLTNLTQPMIGQIECADLVVLWLNKIKLLKRI